MAIVAPGIMVVVSEPAIVINRPITEVQDTLLVTDVSMVGIGTLEVGTNISEVEEDTFVVVMADLDAAIHMAEVGDIEGDVVTNVTNRSLLLASHYPITNKLKFRLTTNEVKLFAVKCREASIISWHLKT